MKFFKSLFCYHKAYDTLNEPGPGNTCQKCGARLQLKIVKDYGDRGERVYRYSQEWQRKWRKWA